MELTPEEIQSVQGTRLQETAPWMSYASEFETKLDSKLEEQIAEYAKRRYDNDQTSNQNKEELHRQREINTELAKQYQWLKPTDYADIEPRIGKILHSSELINRLRKIGLKCWYVDHVHADKLVLRVQPRPGLPHQAACWVQNGYMPEYELMNFDRYGAPLASRMRGWRTCTLQILLQGFLKEEEINREFGKPKGPAAWKSNSLLYHFRNKDSGWEVE